MGILRSLYNIFFHWPKHEIESFTFENVVNKHFKDPDKYSKEEYKKAEDSTQEFVKNQNERMTKSADDLVNHMIWIGGGAILLASTLLLSDKLEFFEYYFLFKLAFVGFSVTLLSALCSFIGEIINTSTFLSAQQASEKIPETFKEAKEGMTHDQLIAVKQKIENAFEDFKTYVNAGRNAAMARNILLFIASIVFLLSLASFVLFGILNLENLREDTRDNSNHEMRIRGQKMYFR